MKIALRPFCFFLLLLAATLPAAAQTAPGRERLLMDFNWKFAFGNADDPKADFGFNTFWTWLDKQNIQTGALGSTFDDSSWRTVNLPHDWGVELPFVSQGVNTWGCRPIGFNFPATSIGWYRKTFDVPASDQGRRFTLEFEGVCRDCVVAVNGIFVGSHASAYTSFAFDITDTIHCGAKNVVVVRVDARENEGWWYQGAGIYRHVWLLKTAPVHVPEWGTQVVSTVNGASAQVAAHIELANDSDQPADVVVSSSIVDPSGQAVATDTQPARHLDPWSAGEVAPVLAVNDPRLWSLDAPNLYQLVTTLSVAGAEVDRYETTFGIRTAVFDPDRGLLLNGQPVKVQGFCDHQQHAGVGTGVPDALWYFRLKKMKEMGCNAIRMSHNPAPPAFLDACDRLGVMVLAEQRLFSSGEEGLGQLESMVRRDRNHPSIVLWSAGNEEYGPGIQSGATGAAMMKTIQDTFHRLDPTRQVTFAASNGGITSGINRVADVRGVNYLILFDHHLLQKDAQALPNDPTPEAYHLHHPHQPMVGTEETDMPDEEQGPHYQNQGREAHWDFIAAHPWFSGAFIWTGFDYYGEDKWPAVVCRYGAMDLCGFPLSGYWFYRQKWTGQAPPPAPAPAGPAAAIQFDPDRSSIRADGEDLSVVDLDVVDARGRLVATADNPLTFSISGPGRIIGLGNGDKESHEPDQGNRRRAYHGHAQVLVQSTREPGTITLTAQAAGLDSAPLKITATSCPPRPFIP